MYSLGEFLSRKNLHEHERFRKGQSYQLKRKDLVDASKTVEAFLIQEDRANYGPPFTVHSYGSVLVTQWLAHTMTVTRINKIKDPPSFVTCSLDKHFKIWSLSGAMWADVNISRFDEKEWFFPFDWVG